MPMRPLWAEVSIDRLTHNYRLLRDQAGNAGLIAVVKANAYGHGALQCAPALVSAGTRWLGVTSVDEGVAVRAACPGARILVMAGLWKEEAEAAVEHRLTPVVWEPVHLEWVKAAARRQGRPVPVHLEIDTGMARQGVRPADLGDLLDRLRATDTTLVEGVMTHFHSPEILDSPSTAGQMRSFDSALECVAARGFNPAVIHAGNSATLLARAGAQSVTDLAAKYGAAAMLRPGLALYGYAPRFAGDGALPAAEQLQPVLEWKTRVISLRTIEPGESAGYGATFRASRTTRLALLPVGYADGLNRLLSNRGAVLVRGQLAPIVGRISMDLTIVDVTGLDAVEPGDEVVLIGTQDGAQGTDQRRITAYDHADLAGTIPYEILCNLNARVPRVTIGWSDGHA